VFVENRLRHLVASGQAQSTVLAPVPWFPSTNPRFGEWARFAAVPRFEKRHGLDIHHPRFIAIPRIGMTISPYLLFAAASRALTELLTAGHQFDLIDAHYFYPDGVAAIWLGKRFNLPVVVTARGSDVTQFPAYALPRALIRRAAGQADAVITVSAGLRAALGKLGVPADRITVLRNGVDLSLFRPPDAAARAATRQALGLTGPTLLSVGGLISRKGHDLTIAALARLPEWRLLIAGEGPERAALAAQAARLGVADRLTLLGPVPHAELPALYGAADLSVLSSEREGWANVLLESMACGTPVIASPIPGNDEVVQNLAAGVIAHARTPAAIAEAVRGYVPDRARTAAYAADFAWDATTAGQLAVFSEILRRRQNN
jgi:glycosyltransferase involved in cell wall biosynthesis